MVPLYSLEHCPAGAYCGACESGRPVRQYPLEPEEVDNSQRERTRRPRPVGFAVTAAYWVAGIIVRFRQLRQNRRDLAHLIESGVLIVLAIVMITLAAVTDMYLHRGVESGAVMPYVVQPSGRELSTNVDMRGLSQEQIESVAETLASSGYGFVRHEVSWADVETTQGEFDWSEYDPIFNALNENDIGVIAVFTDSPEWSWSGNALPSSAQPPADPQMLAPFAEELTSHYADTIRFVQFWHMPNLASQWGGIPATGESFRPYLSALFYAARSGNAEVQIVLPELAMESDVPEGMGDLDFVQSLYDAGTIDIFDLVAIRLDGGQSSPDDRSVEEDKLNFSRAILFRELMVENDDAETPVWATTFGWSADGDNVTREQQAEYVVRGLERAWSEWPWMGLMVQWKFTTLPGDPEASYATAPEGRPTPLFRRLNDPALIRRSDIANTGFTPMDADSLEYSGNWADQHLEGRTFRTTGQTGASVTFEFQGTGLIAYIRTGPLSGDVRIELDGELMEGDGPDGRWSYFDQFATNDLPRRLFSNLEDEIHLVTITLVEPGQLTLGGMVVERQPPFIWPIIMVTASGVLVLLIGLRSFIYLVAIRAGHLTRWENVHSPELPRMPDWVPERYR